ncbi:MAG: oxidoreductase [Deltaproteobacteria bacterium]|nr:oxidoreductase [Deltaproteobacteria bacterium]
MCRQIGLIANLDLCMGCFACEVACKQEHGLSEGKMGLSVVTIGPYEVEGGLAMDFVPTSLDGCDLCSERRAWGDRPFCVQVCPTKALALQTGDEVLKILLGKGRFHLCKIRDTG